VTVDYKTVDGSATSAGGDYLPATGTLTFNPGETSRTVSVTVLGDPSFEPDEAFGLALSNPKGATIAKQSGQATLISSATPSSSSRVRCAVPNLKGKTLAQATSALAGAHCKLGKVTRARGAKGSSTRVGSQSPPAGLSLPADTRVAVTLTKARKTARATRR
jgi:hypothetical protein